MTPDLRSALRAHLLRTGLAGDTRTTRENSVSNAEKLAAGDPDKFLGIGPRGRTAERIMHDVAAWCGCSPSLDERDGPGVIDPDRTLDALGALGDRLGRAAARRERVLFVTGHPTGLLAMYQSIARALGAAGGAVVQPCGGVEDVLEAPRTFRRARRMRYLDGVGVLAAGADLIHTHESWPMDQLLDAVDAVDLVLGDHGWAGAAIAREVETICFNDVNDPALAVARADQLVDVVVPLDDNLPPATYDPLAAYLCDRINANAELAERS